MNSGGAKIQVPRFPSHRQQFKPSRALRGTQAGMSRLGHDVQPQPGLPRRTSKASGVKLLPLRLLELHEMVESAAEIANCVIAYVSLRPKMKLHIA